MKTSCGRTCLRLLQALSLVTLAIVFWAGTPVSGQGTPSQDNGTRNSQIANMDRFLDSHPEIAEQLRKDPSLIRNDEFVTRHPALHEYLQQHPGIREEFTENPNGFMRQEQRFDRREEAGDNRRFGDRDTTRGELANMDRFLDSHPEIAEQLRKDPSLIKNQTFVDKHPQLQQFLQQHPAVSAQLNQNPSAFMQREQRFDQREDDWRDRDIRDRDTTHGELANMDRFLDSHPEIAEQLRKDPSLIKNQTFVDKHPQLQQFLQQHPAVSAQVNQNPSAFMQREQRFDQREDAGRGDMRRGELTSFGQFLGSHSLIAQQLSQNPSLVNNKKWLANHPEARDYLQSHPGAKQEFTQNPQAFMNSVQQASNVTGQQTGKGTVASKPAQPKPKP